MQNFFVVVKSLFPITFVYLSHSRRQLVLGKIFHVMADTFIIYNFNLRVSRCLKNCFQLVFNMFLYFPLAQRHCCFFVLNLLNNVYLKERVRRIRRKVKSQNKYGNRNMNSKQWRISYNCPQKIKVIILIQNVFSPI